MQQKRKNTPKVSLETGINSEVFHPNSQGNYGIVVTEMTANNLLAPLNQVSNKNQQINPIFKKKSINCHLLYN